MVRPEKEIVCLPQPKTQMNVETIISLGSIGFETARLDFFARPNFNRPQQLANYNINNNGTPRPPQFYNNADNGRYFNNGRLFQDDNYNCNMLNMNSFTAPPPPPPPPRSVNCGELRDRNHGEYIRIEGKVHQQRLGRFIELKDHHGSVQLVAPNSVIYW